MNAEKLFHRIGEVSERVGVPAHVLRYWESEFPQLRPRKGSGGQRLYRSGDIELIEQIKTLLYGQGFTIDGARKSIGRQRQPNGPDGPTLTRIGAELDAIASLLD